MEDLAIRLTTLLLLIIFVGLFVVIKYLFDSISFYKITKSKLSFLPFVGKFYIILDKFKISKGMKYLISLIYGIDLVIVLISYGLLKTSLNWYLVWIYSTIILVVFNIIYTILFYKTKK